MREIVDLQNTSKSYRANLARALDRLAEFYTKGGKVDDALTLRREALKIREKLVADFQSEVAFQIGLASEYRSVGDALIAKTKLAADAGEAEALIKEAKAEYRNVINSSLCRDVFASTRGLNQITRLQEEVRKKVLALDGGVR